MGAVQTVAPAALAVAAGHGRHAATVACPVKGLYVPAAHGVAEEPVPAGQ